MTGLDRGNTYGFHSRRGLGDVNNLRHLLDSARCKYRRKTQKVA
jgi:hypothetical protein